MWEMTNFLTLWLENASSKTFRAIQVEAGLPLFFSTFDRQSELHKTTRKIGFAMIWNLILHLLRLGKESGSSFFVSSNAGSHTDSFC
ncbi:hypothetical protein EBB79_17265 [Parasedimentitalea marina]|uniref:Uncharacterized protein n=1 Tax=Parasedimentitalea marina TaxID=2483033 RepID=A0A3T0N657_9RHOB|nr:hypothetical protein EBB79_17265 [Parasedimentitalea marina]